MSLLEPSDGYAIAVDALRAGLALPPEFTISQWADAERVLSPEASAEPGRWRTERAPYLREPMDAISDPMVESVVLQWGAQTGKTEVLLNAAGYYVHMEPSPLLVVYPTVEVGKAWSKDRLAPMLRDTPALQGRVREVRTRDSDNTVLHKKFPGGHITVTGANSPAGLASRPIRVVILDEVDKYPPSAGDLGDPIALAESRAATFWNRKFIKASTPGLKGASRIEQEIGASDQRKWFVPCPDCGFEQVLIWKQVRWQDGDPDTAVYVCERCGSCWPDARRIQAVCRGRWVATAPFYGVAGFWLSALNSPWVRLPKVARRFLQVKDLPQQFKVFVNEVLAETWVDQSHSVNDAELYHRREEYGLETPIWVGVITAGVDVQDDRLHVEIVGWGADWESWSLDYVVLPGDPAGSAVWEDLDRLLTRRWPGVDGVSLPVQAVCVDTGGHHGEEVHQFCGARLGRRVLPIKGKDGDRQVWPVTVSRNRGGRRLYIVGVDKAKMNIYEWLRREEPGPGYCHFPTRYGEAYFRELTAERLVINWRGTKAYPAWELKSLGRPNEALDCRVYAYAALCYLIRARLDLRREVERRAKKAGALPAKRGPRVVAPPASVASDPYL